ncbi:hypothetical protein KQX54_021884 [Cotesia glomerata]|uniref:Uncharacterized protein n=1 Tax=Cotesia glomerata TaxID=32391 RepID=A0AAV7JAF7_COTGL|nr:hypothetical protein KQX54_021884 [Cotesia glomerata]
MFPEIKGNERKDAREIDNGAQKKMKKTEEKKKKNLYEGNAGKVWRGDAESTWRSEQQNFKRTSPLNICAITTAAAMTTTASSVTSQPHLSPSIAAPVTTPDHRTAISLQAKQGISPDSLIFRLWTLGMLACRQIEVRLEVRILPTVEASSAQLHQFIGWHKSSPSLYTTSIRCLVCMVKRVKLDARGFKGQRLNGVIESWLQGAALRCFFQGSTIYHFSRPLSFAVSLAFSRLVRPVSKSREKKSIMQFKL